MRNSQSHLTDQFVFLWSSAPRISGVKQQHQSAWEDPCDGFKAFSMMDRATDNHLTEDLNVCESTSLKTWSYGNPPHWRPGGLWVLLTEDLKLWESTSLKTLRCVSPPQWRPEGFWVNRTEDLKWWEFTSVKTLRCVSPPHWRLEGVWDYLTEGGTFCESYSLK